MIYFKKLALFRLISLGRDENKIWLGVYNHWKLENEHRIDSSSRQSSKTNFVRCSYCNKEEPAAGTYTVYKRCKLAHYCSEDCQLLHWKAKENSHKNDCQKVKIIV